MRRSMHIWLHMVFAIVQHKALCMSSVRMMHFWSLFFMLMTCCSLVQTRCILLILRLNWIQLLRCQIWASCIIIWAFNFSNVMGVMLCVKQSKLRLCCVDSVLRIANLLLLLWKQVWSWVFMMLETTLMLPSISRMLVALFTYALRGQTFNFQSHKWAGLCIAQDLSIGKQLSGSFATWVALDTLDCFIPRGDHCRHICMLFQILTGLVAMTHACPLTVFASCLVAHVYHGWARSSLQWPLPVVKLSTGQLSQLRLSAFGSSCISWLSKKQPTVATSSCEAKYRAAFTATVECVWLRCLAANLGVG